MRELLYRDEEGHGHVAAEEKVQLLLSRLTAISKMDQQTSLNCAKDIGLLPPSFSLHSVDLLPIDDKVEPKFCCLTLRNTSNGHLFNSDFRASTEIRVVHGSTEVHDCVSQVLNGAKVNADKPPALANPDGIWNLPFRIPLNETKTTIQGMCWILETIIQNGWEISTSCLTLVNLGFDVVSYFLKKSSSPALHNAQVAAVIVDATSAKIEVISHRNRERHVDINNAIFRAVKKFTPSKNRPTSSNASASRASSQQRCSSNFAKEIEAELRKSFENLVEKENKPAPPRVIKSFAGPMFNKNVRDDPQCPSEFTYKEEQEGGLLCSQLVLEIAHLLFCRQWKLICHSTLPSSDSNQMEVMFFCRDGRILPALGQQSFAMIDLEQPNLMRLFNVEDSIRECLKACVNKTQPHLEQISESGECTVFKWKHPVWLHFLEDNNEPKESLWIKESLAMLTICNILLVMNRNELNLYGVSRLVLKETGRKRCQLVFRQSNIAYSRCLCLHLSGTNKLILIGANHQEINMTRTVLKSRWPYPIGRDEELILDDKHKSWLFKLKRHPWAMSYGHKHLDKAAEMAQSLLHKNLAPPKNTDVDSGKSILVFLIKAYSEEGWRVQASIDIGSAKKGSYKHTHPWSIILMR